MIIAKYIKIFCCVLMAVVLLISTALFFLGVSGLSDGSRVAIVWFVLSAALPLIVSVALYPIFALASIDENIAKMNQKMDTLIAQGGEQSAPAAEAKVYCAPAPSIHASGAEASRSSSMVEAPSAQAAEVKAALQKESVTASVLSSKEKAGGEKPAQGDVFDYFNQEFGISLLLEDDCESLKVKILAIEGGGFPAIILKKKVEQAQTREELIDALVAHKELFLKLD